MSSAKRKVLFVYQVPLPFIKKDIDILRSAYEVREVRFRGYLNILSLFRGVLWCDVTFSWFGSIHAFFTVFFSKILGKKSIIVAGGHEVAREPDIKYGMFLYWWKRWCPLYIFSHADLILSVSKNTTDECIRNARAQKERIELLYHGFDSSEFKPVKTMEKEPIVITIGRVNAGNIKKKGLELFVQSAQFMPEIRFFLVGPWDDDSIGYLKKSAPANVTFTGGLYGTDLVNLCSRAKVYVQVSCHESFGCSIAEAMLCGCIPVVSRRAAIPEVVGDCGIYVDKLVAEEVAEKIRYALTLSDDYGTRARNRIIEEFPLDKRRQKILEIIDMTKN